MKLTDADLKGTGEVLGHGLVLDLVVGHRLDGFLELLSGDLAEITSAAKRLLERLSAGE